MIISAGVYELDDDPGRVDRGAVWEFLSRPDHTYLERPRRRALRQDLR